MMWLCKLWGHNFKIPFESLPPIRYCSRCGFVVELVAVPLR